MDNGCADCRAKVYGGDPPPLLATNVKDHLRLRQCAICGALWLYAERYYQVIPEEEAVKLFGSEWLLENGRVNQSDDSGDGII